MRILVLVIERMGMSSWDYFHNRLAYILAESLQLSDLKNKLWPPGD